MAIDWNPFGVLALVSAAAAIAMGVVVLRASPTNAQNRRPFLVFLLEARSALSLSLASSMLVLLVAGCAVEEAAAPLPKVQHSSIRGLVVTPAIVPIKAPP